MVHKRSRWFVMAGIMLGGCAEALPSAMAPAVPDAGVLAQVAGGVDPAAPLDDAATRATLGLADAATASLLQAQMLAIASAMRAGDVTAARSALRTAQSTYDAYDARANPGDQSDRAVIELALEGADATLRSGKKG